MRAEILDAALDVAERGHYLQITREDIASAAGVSPGLVAYYLGPMDRVRDAVMTEAVRVERLAVVAQGLSARDPIALEAPRVLRHQAARALV